MNKIISHLGPKTLKKIVKECVDEVVNEQMGAMEDASRKLVLWKKTMPDFIKNLKELKAERAGSFYTLVVRDSRGNKATLVPNIATERQAKLLIPIIQQEITRIQQSI